MECRRRSRETQEQSATSHDTGTPVVKWYRNMRTLEVRDSSMRVESLEFVHVLLVFGLRSVVQTEVTKGHALFRSVRNYHRQSGRDIQDLGPGPVVAGVQRKCKQHLCVCLCGSPLHEQPSGVIVRRRFLLCVVCLRDAVGLSGQLVFFFRLGLPRSGACVGGVVMTSSLNPCPSLLALRGRPVDLVVGSVLTLVLLFLSSFTTI